MQNATLELQPITVDSSLDTWNRPRSDDELHAFVDSRLEHPDLNSVDLNI